MRDVTLTLSERDAWVLHDLLGERPNTERWSGRVYVALREALELEVKPHMRAAAGLNVHTIGGGKAW